MELRGGREGACCVEQRQDGRGGQCDRNIDGVPKMGVMCGAGRSQKGSWERGGEGMAMSNIPKRRGYILSKSPKSYSTIISTEGRTHTSQPLRPGQSICDLF